MRLLVLSSIVAGALGVHCTNDPYAAAPLDTVEDSEGAPSATGQREGEPTLAATDAGSVALAPSPSPVPAGDAAAAADSGGQHQHAKLAVHWTWRSTGIWNVDQTIAIDARAPSTFYAHQFGFAGTKDVAYVGIQTDGIRLDGTKGDTAIFSVWNATAATAAGGAACGTFGGEGSGFSCRVPIVVAAGRSYKLRVWRLDADASGQWWGAWLIDANGIDTAIGSIRARAGAIFIGSNVTFAEYFGPKVGCDAVPLSLATFATPRANFGETAYALSAGYGGAVRGACTGGSATPGPSGVSIVFGGIR